MMGYHQQRPKIGLTVCPDLVDHYKQQFVIWQYNAYKHGMKEHQLNAPLTKIDRERSDGEMR